MKALWPQSLAGRLILWLLLVLTLAMAMALVLQRVNNARLLAQVAEDDAVTRITMVSRILEQSGTAKWPQTLHAATSEDFRFSLGENVFIKATKKGGKDKYRSPPLTPELRHLKNGKTILFIAPSADSRKKQKFRTVTITSEKEIYHDPVQTDRLSLKKKARARSETEIFIANASDSSMKFSDTMANIPDLARYRRKLSSDENGAMDIAIKLENGRWLNAAFTPRTLPFWSLEEVWFLGLLVLAIGGVIVLVVRAETRPMQRLAQAAEALGRGEHLPPLDENGPREIRLAVEAFNLMRARLGNFVQDRTRMLAAMSHDLRTPLTTLRLRAEMIEEPEARKKLIETIEEMHRITEASLSFAREDDNTEETQKIDLNALVRDLCEEANAMGKDARMETEAATLNARVRPAAIRRALRNLIDNAVRYGEHANVTMTTKDSEIRIAVEDDGPGIDEAQLEDVFAPFVRLENSRNTETGGAGLGLAIARTIARAHGGDVVLQNREGGGLRAIFSVPTEAG